jgi:hypothetical protein
MRTLPLTDPIRRAAAGLLALTAACSTPPDDLHLAKLADMDIAADIDARLARFAPVEIRADLGDLSEQDRQVLAELIAASRPMGEIFLRQAGHQNVALRQALRDAVGPMAAAARRYFRVMAGPWDRLDESNFLGAGGERPEGAGFYPQDMSREEFRDWLEDRPDDRESFESLFTVLVRRGNALTGGLTSGLAAVPYAKAYEPWLEDSARHLLQAAERTGDPSLRRFLESRAKAFRTDDYYQSDKDWMDLDGRIEITIGPYEVYEDRLLGLKAAYEAFVTVVSKELSEKLTAYKSELPFLERNLPIPDEIKNLDRGTESPIRVADLVYSDGDTRAGVQTIAFNLPNDERVREEKGSKKVILRNVMDAKYATIMEPLAKRVLDEAHHADLRQQAFFDETLFHELSHGLGPGKLVLDGRETEVRKELGAIYSTSEECKADVMGAYNVLAMIDQGHFDAEYRTPFLTTYFAGLFRSVRFGVAEAHGRGACAQIRYFVEQGGASFDPATGRYTIDVGRLEELIGALTREICVQQAAGDQAGSVAFFERYGVLDADLERVLGGLEDLPVDIRPIFVDAGETGN